MAPPARYGDRPPLPFLIPPPRNYGGPWQFTRPSASPRAPGRRRPAGPVAQLSSQTRGILAGAPIPPTPTSGTINTPMGGSINLPFQGPEGFLQMVSGQAPPEGLAPPKPQRGGVNLDRLVELYYKTPAGERFKPEGGGGGLGGLFESAGDVISGGLVGMPFGPLGPAVGGITGGLLGRDGGEEGPSKGEKNVREMLRALRGEGLSRPEAREALRSQFRLEAGGGAGGLGPRQQESVASILGYAPGTPGAPGAGGMSQPEMMQDFFETTVLPYAESKYGQMLDAANQYEQQMFAIAPQLGPGAQEMVATSVPQIAAQMRQEAGAAFSQFMGSDPATSWYGRILDADRRYQDVANQLYGDMAGGMGAGYMDPFAAADPMAMFANDPFMSSVMGAGTTAQTGGGLGMAQLPQPTAAYNPYAMATASGLPVGGGRSAAYTGARYSGTNLDDFFPGGFVE